MVSRHRGSVVFRLNRICSSCTSEMGIYGMSILMEVALGFALVALLFYKYLTRNFDYWKNKGIVYVEPKLSFFRSSTEKDIFRESFMILYNKYKSQRFVGMISLTFPFLMVTDPELIKKVMTKDFTHFEDRGMLIKLPHDFLVKHLFHMEGDDWRRMRSKLSPTFTSGKMKTYFTLIESVAKQLTDHLEPLAESNSTIDIKELLARFTIDIIATCAFGLEVNSINDPDNEIRRIGRLLMEPSYRDILVSVVYPHVPWLPRILPLTYTRPEVSAFILKLLTDTVEYRNKNNVVRNDFIDLMLKIKEKTITVDKEDDMNVYQDRTKTDNSDGLTHKEMAAQMSVFFGAGFETAASTTTFLFYELAANPNIQEKVRNEINTIIEKKDGKFTYQCLQEMRYLDKCINETLRRYASLPFLMRKCNKAYKIPDSDVVLDEGDKVIIPIYPIHHDPEYYPDPFKFDPERFSEDAVNSRHQYTFIPFGEGPRICIGKRMGIMQVQMAVVNILSRYELKLAPGIPTVLPISPTNFLTKPEIPVELIVSKRKEKY